MSEAEVVAEGERPLLTPPLERVPGRRRLLVIGLGPAGLSVVRALAGEFEVVAVEPKDYYEFAPGILRGLADPSSLRALQVRLEDALAGYGVQRLRGRVLRLHADSAEVCLPSTTGAAMGPSEGLVEVPFDYAVIASGSRYSSGGPWKASGAAGEDAAYTLEGRAAQLRNLHEALLDQRACGGAAVLVGAGLVGVELAAELAHFLPGLRVVLAGRAPTVLPDLPGEAQDYAADWLVAHGVELRLGLNEPLPEGSEAQALGFEGPCMMLGCAGVRPCSQFAEALGCLDAQGAVLVNRALQLTSAPRHIFALGDCVRVEDVEPTFTKDTYPAEAMAEVVIDNLRRLLAGEAADGCECAAPELREMPEALNQFTICSLGPDDAVFVANGAVRMTGWTAATAKSQVESTKMGQYRQELWGSLVWSLVPHW